MCEHAKCDVVIASLRSRLAASEAEVDRLSRLSSPCLTWAWACSVGVGAAARSRGPKTEVELRYFNKYPCPGCSTGYAACAQGWLHNLKCCKDCVHPGRFGVGEPYTAEELEAAWSMAERPMPDSVRRAVNALRSPNFPSPHPKGTQ